MKTCSVVQSLLAGLLVMLALFADSYAQERAQVMILGVYHFYLQLARVRSADKFVGSDVLADWYKRNLRIFTNLIQTIESPNDRVIVIFGQGHGAYLREWVKAYPELQLVEPNDYLTKH